MIKVNKGLDKEVKFVTADGFTSYKFNNGNVYEDVENYYYIPNFYNLNATGIFPKKEYTLEVVG